MRKINVGKSVLNAFGKPTETESPINGTTQAVLNQIKSYNISSPEKLVKAFKQWQKELKETKKSNMTIRDSQISYSRGKRSRLGIVYSIRNG